MDEEVTEKLAMALVQERISWSPRAFIQLVNHARPYSEAEQKEIMAAKEHLAKYLTDLTPFMATNITVENTDLYSHRGAVVMIYELNQVKKKPQCVLKCRFSKLLIIDGWKFILFFFFSIPP